MIGLQSLLNMVATEAIEGGDFSQCKDYDSSQKINPLPEPPSRMPELPPIHYDLEVNFQLHIITDEFQIDYK